MTLLPDGSALSPTCRHPTSDPNFKRTPRELRLTRVVKMYRWGVIVCVVSRKGDADVCQAMLFVRKACWGRPWCDRAAGICSDSRALLGALCFWYPILKSKCVSANQDESESKKNKGNLLDSISNRIGAFNLFMIHRSACLGAYMRALSTQYSACGIKLEA
jgi:hypothetical protein